MFIISKGKKMNPKGKKDPFSDFFKKRVLIVFILVFLVFVIVVLNLFRIQVIYHFYWSKVANDQYERIVDIQATRGLIVSNDGFSLAYDLVNYQVVLDPIQIPPSENQNLANLLAPMVDVDAQTIVAQLQQKQSQKSKYLQFKTLISLDQRSAINDYILTHRDLRGCIFFSQVQTRVYPNDPNLKPVVGFINSTQNGVFGLEDYYNDKLKGVNGTAYNYMSTFINFALPVGKRSYQKPADDGDTVVLNINYKLQHILEDAVANGVEKNNAAWGVGIIMDPNNGKILAMTSVPVSNSLVYLKNNAIYNQYEPGSTFKPLIVAYALDHNIINQNDTFQVGKTYKVYKSTFKDAEDLSGNLSIGTILAESSNIGMIQIGQRYSPSQFWDMMNQWGITSKTGIDLPSELLPYNPPPQNWSGITQATISFGQGVAVTPIQLITAEAAVINGGTLYQPQIVDKLLSPDGRLIKQFKPVAVRQVITPQVSALMRQYLGMVVSDGSGVGTSIDGYTIGGKTGTAQKSFGKLGYLPGKYDASFVAFFPVDNPKYICLVLIDTPHPNYYAAQVAVPIFKTIFQQMVETKDVLPSNLAQQAVYLNNSGGAVSGNALGKNKPIPVNADSPLQL